MLSDTRTLQTATAGATGGTFETSPGVQSFQAVLTCTSGNCTGTVIFEVSADGENWVTLATTAFSSAASPQTDGFVTDGAWPYVRSRVTAISGTGASLSTYQVY